MTHKVLHKQPDGALVPVRSKCLPGTTDRETIKAAIDQIPEDRLGALREIVEIVRTGEHVDVHAVRDGFFSKREYRF